MISIKRLLEGKSDSGDPAFFRLASLLLEAVAVHAVNHDPAQFIAFRDAVRNIRLEVEQAESSAHALLLSGEAVHSMELYNRGVESFLRTQGQEFRQILRMLSHSLLEVSRAGDASSANLRLIEKELEHTSRLDDLAVMKSKLGESLRALADENARQRKQTEQFANGLKGQLTAVCSQADRHVDSVTALPDATVALAEIEAILSGAAGQDPGYAALFRVDRLDTINSRYGYAVGDRILLSFAQLIAQQLASADKLHRWRGPALLAVLQRPGRVHDVRVEISRVASVRREETLEIHNRSILLPLACSVATIPLRDHTTVESVSRAIEAFLGASVAPTRD